MRPWHLGMFGPVWYPVSPPLMARPIVYLGTQLSFIGVGRHNATAEFSVPRRCATADTLHPRRSMAWGHG